MVLNDLRTELGEILFPEWNMPSIFGSTVTVDVLSRADYMRHHTMGG